MTRLPWPVQHWPMASRFDVLGTGLISGASGSGFTFLSQARRPWRLAYSSLTPLVPVNCVSLPPFHPSSSLQFKLSQIPSFPPPPSIYGRMPAKQTKAAEDGRPENDKEVFLNPSNDEFYFLSHSFNCKPPFPNLCFPDVWKKQVWTFLASMIKIAFLQTYILCIYF